MAAESSHFDKDYLSDLLDDLFSRSGTVTLSKCWTGATETTCRLASECGTLMRMTALASMGRRIVIGKEVSNILNHILYIIVGCQHPHMAC